MGKVINPANENRRHGCGYEWLGRVRVGSCEQGNGTILGCHRVCYKSSVPHMNHFNK